MRTPPDSDPVVGECAPLRTIDTLSEANTGLRSRERVFPARVAVSGRAKVSDSETLPETVTRETVTLTTPAPNSNSGNVLRQPAGTLPKLIPAGLAVSWTRAVAGRPKNRDA